MSSSFIYSSHSFLLSTCVLSVSTYQVIFWYYSFVSCLNCWWLPNCDWDLNWAASSKFVAFTVSIGVYFYYNFLPYIFSNWPANTYKAFNNISWYKATVFLVKHFKSLKLLFVCYQMLFVNWCYDKFSILNHIVIFWVYYLYFLINTSNFRNNFQEHTKFF